MHAPTTRVGVAWPPGLDTIRPVGWSDVAMEVTDSSPSGSTFGGGAFLDASLSSCGRVMMLNMAGDRLLEMLEDVELLVW
jgi:hypothetical protein